MRYAAIHTHGHHIPLGRTGCVEGLYTCLSSVVYICVHVCGLVFVYVYVCVCVSYITDGYILIAVLIFVSFLYNRQLGVGRSR